MTRTQLEHVLRASGDIADDDEIIVIGSQSILGQFPAAPSSLLVSVEADVYPKNHPERWEVIDGCIGEGSAFHDTFGYYAQGVEEGTATLPEGWQHRLVRICNPNTRGVAGLCLEIHDLVLSKYVANREKDRRFGSDAGRCGLVDARVLSERLTVLPVDEARRALIAQSLWVDGIHVR